VIKLPPKAGTEMMHATLRSLRALGKAQAIGKEKVGGVPPCVVALVRDPISRFICAYGELEYRWRKYKEEFTKVQLEDDRSSGLLGSTNKKLEDVRSFTKRASTFIRGLIAGKKWSAINHTPEGLWSLHGKINHAGGGLWHFLPMSHGLEGHIRFDFVLRLDRTNLMREVKLTHMREKHM
jgi:hypothetical protein